MTWLKTHSYVEMVEDDVVVVFLRNPYSNRYGWAAVREGELLAWDGWSADMVSYGRDLVGLESFMGDHLEAARLAESQLSAAVSVTLFGVRVPIYAALAEGGASRNRARDLSPDEARYLLEAQAVSWLLLGPAPGVEGVDLVERAAFGVGPGAREGV